ncbi:glycosyltransferase, partial [candidate division WOR-3 bacterium]|nr:glycosyltransferase [candidate division WOR-3 bacterium]
RACRECAAIIETNATRAGRFRLCGVEARLVPNYPPLELLAEPAPTRKPVVAYTGLACRERGFDLLLEAFARLAGALPEARLLAIGDFDPRTGIEAWSRRFVRERGLEARVEFAGRLPYGRLLGRLRDCLCGVILFQPDRENDYTGQPNKLFEFMGAGLGVIASGFPEMFGVVARHRCGWSVDPTNVEAIAETLRRALGEPARTQAAGLRGREAVLERYNWRVAETALLDVYREAGC